MPKKKRRRTWGSITTVTRGKHVLRWVENTPEGRKRRSLTFYGTYKEADAELARIRVKVGDDAPVPTIGQAYEMWWKPDEERRLSEGLIAPGTARLRRIAWNGEVEKRWANVPVDSIRPIDVQTWLSSLNRGTAKAAISVLRGIVDFAVRYEVVESNKFRIPYDIPAKKIRTRDKTVYCLAEADDMFERLRGSRVEAPFILACFGSARTGESLCAKAAEVEIVESHGLKMALVPIDRTIGPKGSEPVGRLKNAQSHRTLAIPEPYGTRLAEIAAERIEAGSEWLADRGDGLPFNTTAFRYAWISAAGDPIPFANLRNSWRTFAQAEWCVDYDVLEILMGHVLPGVTGRHYLRMSPMQLADHVAKAVAKYRGI